MQRATAIYLPQISPSCRTLPNGSFNYLNGWVRAVCSLGMQSGIHKKVASLSQLRTTIGWDRAVILAC